MLLAAKYKLAHVPTPAGGCLLTDPNFSKRLKDLIDNEGLEFIDRIELLKYGRHIRFSCKLKLVVGRNQNDNNEITRLARATDYLFSPVELMGPVALLNDTASEEELRRAASICARYSDADPVNQFVEIRICRDKTEEKLKVMPLDPLSAGLRFL